MKNMTLKAVSLVSMTGLMLACNQNKEGAAPAAVDREQVKKEIQTKEDAFAEVYNSGALRNIGYYADDATSFIQNREPLVGKEAILSFLQSDIISNTNKISFKTSEIFSSNDGNMVVEIGAFKVVDSTNNPINTGNYMTMFEKRDGKYVAVRDMSTSDGRQVSTY
jgi:ketosteroid isomerase-like protein